MTTRISRGAWKAALLASVLALTHDTAFGQSARQLAWRQPTPAEAAPEAPLPAPMPPAAPQAIASDAEPGPLTEQVSRDTSAYICDEGCDAPCCDCLCGNCSPLWARAEYLGWWTKGVYLPPLVTTNPGATPTVLGQTGTQILFGDSNFGNDYRSGWRIRGGGWLDACHVIGIEGDYFNLGETSDRFTAQSTGNPILTRPFINSTTGQPSVEFVAVPGIVTGSITAVASSDLQSAGVDLKYNWCCSADGCGGGNPYDSNSWSNCCRRIDLVGGYRYYRLRDTVTIHETLVSTNTSGNIAVGTIIDIEDRFETENEFNGGELGVQAEFYRNKWSLDLLAKAAFGNNHQTLTIDGRTTVTTPNGAVAVNQGGLLALNNMGTYTADDFVVIPHFAVTVGYQLTCNLKVYAGYDFIYWGTVLRAADQIDLNINPAQLPPNTVPGAQPQDPFATDFWAQGVKLGIELSY